MAEFHRSVVNKVILKILTTYALLEIVLLMSGLISEILVQYKVCLTSFEIFDKQRYVIVFAWEKV